MHHRARDITDIRLHFLTAVCYVGSNGKKSLWKIRCDCGEEVIMPATEFLKGKQKSCDCMRSKLIADTQQTHGMSQHPAYAVWRSMLDRCRLPTHQAWENYGGRGIRVCAKWQDDFMNFWVDMGPAYRRGLSLDRIDVNGDYCPENCRWVDDKIQARNKRNNVTISSPWGVMTVAEASERSGIGVTTLLYRMQNGCPADLLFSRPDVTNRFTTSSMPDHAGALL